MYSTTSLRRRAGQQRGQGERWARFVLPVSLQPDSPRNLPDPHQGHFHAREQSRVPLHKQPRALPHSSALALVERVCRACRNRHPQEPAPAGAMPGGQEGATCCPQPPKASAASARWPSGVRATQAAGAGGDRQGTGHQKEKQREVCDSLRSGLAIFKHRTGAKLAQLLQSSRNRAEVQDLRGCQGQDLALLHKPWLEGPVSHSAVTPRPCHPDGSHQWRSRQAPTELPEGTNAKTSNTCLTC